MPPPMPPVPPEGVVGPPACDAEPAARVCIFRGLGFGFGDLEVKGLEIWIQSPISTPMLPESVACDAAPAVRDPGLGLKVEFFFFGVLVFGFWVLGSGFGFGGWGMGMRVCGVGIEV